MKTEVVERSKDLNDGAGDGSEFLSGRNMRAPSQMPARARARAQSPVALGDSPVSDADAGDAWRLEPHVCRACFSRLVSRQVDGNTRRYVCTNCGVAADGPGPEVVCSCGLKIRRPTKGAKSGITLVDARVRCAANPDPRPEFPSLFVATEQ